MDGGESYANETKEAVQIQRLPQTDRPQEWLLRGPSEDDAAALRALRPWL